MGESKRINLAKALRGIQRCIAEFLKEIQLRYYSHNKSGSKKILGYWDFNKRGESIGDFLIFLEDLNMLRFKFNLARPKKKNIDICFIDDEKKYNTKSIYCCKTYMWKKNLKTLTITCPYVDNVFHFSSNSEFEKFYCRNRAGYFRWPNEFYIEACDNKILDKFYKKNRFLPKLGLPSEIIGRIYDFYEEKVYPSLPVVLNIRKNTRAIERNSNVNELKKFLKHYEKNKAYKFIVVCEKAEIPGEFRKLKNVLFSKDYFNDIEYDLGFIKTSYLSIFPSSGMGGMAWFGDVPFIQYGVHMQGNPTVPAQEKKFSFFAEYQRHYHRKETAKWLISEFEDLVRYLKEKNINNTLKSKAKDNKKYMAEF